MVQKETSTARPATRARGRPRAYDPDRALARAMEAFWRLGYAGTSLDRLSDATDMNRPSMYAAFGDKHALYLKTLDSYTAAAAAEIQKALDPALPLHEALRRFYDAALSAYLPAGMSARGCYLISTATTEAAEDPEVRAKLLGALRGFDRAIEARFRQAKARGEVDAAADAATLAMVVSAVLHTLSIRSRAGDSRAALNDLVESTINLVCNKSARSTSKRKRSSRKL